MPATAESATTCSHSRSAIACGAPSAAAPGSCAAACSRSMRSCASCAVLPWRAGSRALRSSASWSTWVSLEHLVRRVEEALAQVDLAQRVQRHRHLGHLGRQPQRLAVRARGLLCAVEVAGHDAVQLPVERGAALRGWRYVVDALVLLELFRPPTDHRVVLRVRPGAPLQIGRVVSG
eukprot:scaffold73935_cov48-Phaeocystis_antarctica.AAC.7